MARLPNLIGVLSASFFRIRRSENDADCVVPDDRLENSHSGTYSRCLLLGRRWGVHGAIRIACETILLVARSDSAVHLRRRLRQPASVVPVAAGSIAAVFAGSACALLGTRVSRSAPKLAGSMLVVAVLALSALVAARIYYHPIAAPLRNAGLLLNEITPENSLIAAADNGDPTLLYYGERKGWHCLEQGGTLLWRPGGERGGDRRSSATARKRREVLVFTSNTAWWLDLFPEFRQYLHANSALIGATSEFSIYRLDPISK